MNDLTEHRANLPTRRWIEAMVFNQSMSSLYIPPPRRQALRFSAIETHDLEGFAEALSDEFCHLVCVDNTRVSSILFTVAGGFNRYREFRDVLSRGQIVIEELGLVGVAQMQIFHPEYRFPHTPSDALVNYLQRSPLPVLHLIRDEDMGRPPNRNADPHRVYAEQLQRLDGLGKDRLNELFEGWRQVESAEI